MKKKPKYPPLHINASHPFPLRNRCANCGSRKLCYSYDYTNPYWYPNTRYARDRGLASFEGWLQGCQSDYQMEAFARLEMRIDPVHSVAFKRYNPKLSRSWSGGEGRHYISQMVVVVSCEACDMQTWWYMNLHNLRMPENKHRKARINCPEMIYPMKYKSKRW